MSKYEVNDKFIIEIAEVCTTDRRKSTEEGHTLYRVKGFNSLVFDDNGLDKLQKCETELSWDECYNKGLNDAWELVQRLCNIPPKEIELIFCVDNLIWDEREFIEFIVKRHTPQEALAKLEAYEIEQTEIKEGDIFEFNHSRCCVISTNNKIAKVLWKSGDTGNFEVNFLKRLPKKGFVDIKSVLKQIGGSDV